MGSQKTLLIIFTIIMVVSVSYAYIEYGGEIAKYTIISVLGFYVIAFTMNTPEYKRREKERREREDRRAEIYDEEYEREEARIEAREDVREERRGRRNYGNHPDVYDVVMGKPRRGRRKRKDWL